MFRASSFCMLFLIVVSWAFGGGFSWGPWLVGSGGLLCLGWAVVEVLRNRGKGQKLWSWRIAPWLMWIAFVGISILNPSHAPEDSKLGKFTTPQGPGSWDTLGIVNPAVPVDHIEWLPASSDANRTTMYLFSTVGIMAFSLALAISPSTRSEIRRTLKFLFANVMLLTLIGFYFYFFSEEKLIFGKYLAEGGIPFASFHYKNSWAAYAILSVGIGLGLADHYWKSGHQLLGKGSLTPAFLLAIPIILSSIPLLESRSGLLLMLLLVVWAVFDHCRGRRFGSLRGKILLIPSVAIILIMGWWGWKTSAPQLEKMYNKSKADIEQVNADQPTGRMILIRDTIEMAKAKPWFGWGLATFSQIYPVFQGPELYGKIEFPGGEEFAWVPEYYEFAHCDWVQYWAETGTIGLVLLLATPIAWVIHFLRRGRPNPLSYWLSVGCILILLLATFEFPSGCEAVSLLFAACLSLSGKYALLTKERSLHRHRRDEHKSVAPHRISSRTQSAGQSLTNE